MAALTTAQVLDAAQTMLADQSADLRLKMLAWLNLAMQSVINEPREWEFLKKSASVVVDTNTITLPADYSDFISLTVGNYFFAKKDQMTPVNVFEATDPSAVVPVGFTIDEMAGTISIVPGTDETTAILAYKATLPAAGYSDDSTSTIFPAEFKNLFFRYLLTARNEFDVEDQVGMSMQLDAVELRKMKALDNKRKARPPVERQAYTRAR